MATLLDIGLLQHFQIIFPFLFITIFIFAIFSLVKPFGDNPFANVSISVILGFMTLLSPVIRKTINIMAPWFVLLIMFIVLILFSVQVLGGTREGIWESLMKAQNHYIIVWVVAIALVIGLGSLSAAISEERGFRALAEEGEVAPGEERAGFFQVIFHPKVLGLVLILIIAIITVGRLSQVVTK